MKYLVLQKDSRDPLKISNDGEFVPLKLLNDISNKICDVKINVDGSKLFFDYEPTSDQIHMIPFVTFIGNTSFFDGHCWTHTDITIMEVVLGTSNMDSEIKSLKDQSI